MRFVESESGVGFLRKGLSSENREAAVVAVVRSGAMAKSLLKMLEGVETVSVWEDCCKSFCFLLPISLIGLGRRNWKSVMELF